MEGEDLSTDDSGFIDRVTAVQLVRDPEKNTRAPEDVQQAVWARIEG